MSRLAALLERWVPNPWAAASREGRSERLSLLAEMAGMLLGKTEPEAVLRLLFDRAPADLGLDYCMAYTADEVEQVLSATYLAGLSEAAAVQLERVRFDDAGLCGQVAKTRAPVVVADIVYDDTAEVAMARRLGFHAYAGFPLLAREGGGLLGVLAFASRRLERFTTDDVEFFRTVANHVAVVHEHSRADKALKEGEEQFRTLADSIPHLAWMARPDGFIFWYNQRWLDYTGATAEEARGMGWRNVIHPDHVEQVVARLHYSWDTGQPWEDTFPMRRKDGQWRWFLSRALPIRDSRGRIVRWFGTNTDVTEQREAEEALLQARDEAERARREAEAANCSKSRFLAAASHDLRQPMQSMLLLAMVLENEVTSQRGRETLVHLQRGMDALKGLLDGLLDVSRLDAGVVQPELRDFPVSDLLEQLQSTFQPVAQGKGLAWRLDPCGVTVHSDPTLLGRILRNLVENAVRYTEEGTIRLSCEVEGGAVVLSVEDSGIGIPSEHLDRIWDEFHQVGNVERDRSQGIGLGLAIVRRLAQLLGHPVEVRSRVGVGSCFSITVPRGEAVAAAPEADAAGVDGKGGVVLLIDDDAMVLLGLQSIFRVWGYDVMIAGSGDQAVATLEAGGPAPDVVVSDFRLRNGEVGTDAIRRVRDRLHRDVPGIVLTGEASREAERAAAAAGLGFVHKPVTPRQLSAAMESCLGGGGGATPPPPPPPRGGMPFRPAAG